MTSLSSALRAHRWGLCMAVVAGAALGGFAGRGYATSCTHVDPGLVIEGPFAQDTDFDGVATVAEGNVDIDSDMQFGLAEAQYFGMCEYIAWAMPAVQAPDSNKDVQYKSCLIDTTVTPVSHFCHTNVSSRVWCKNGVLGPCSGTIITPP